MKTRRGFVSNSSTTSFVVDLGSRSMPALAAELILSRNPISDEELQFLDAINDMFDLPIDANIALSLSANNFCFPSSGCNTRIAKVGDVVACNASMNDHFSDQDRGVKGVRRTGRDKLQIEFDGESFNMSGIPFADVSMSKVLRGLVERTQYDKWENCHRKKSCWDDQAEFKFAGASYQRFCEACFPVLQPFAKTKKDHIALSSSVIQQTTPCHLIDRICGGDDKYCKMCVFKKKDIGHKMFSGVSTFERLYEKSLQTLCQEMKERIIVDPIPTCFMCGAPKDLTEFFEDKETHRMPMEAALCDPCLRNILDIGIYSSIDNL